MSPKKRSKVNAGLPKRWCWRHGALYYQVPPGLESKWDGKKLLRLGSTLPDAYRSWADRIDVSSEEINTIDELADRYVGEHVLSLAPKTQEGYRISVTRIKKVFGHMPVETFEPQHTKQYFDKIKRMESHAVARSDITVLRGLFAKAMDWGVLKSHPMLGMRFEQLAAATDEVHEWEIDEMLSISPDSRSVLVGQLYTKLKLMIRLRRGDILRLKLTDIKDDGIHATPHKTAKTSGVRMIFKWTDDEGNDIPELRQLIDDILAIPPRRIGDTFLFTTRQGKGFMNEKTGRSNASDSLWQRYMDKVMELTEVDHRIKEKTLRAYVGDASASLEDAKERLGHVNSATTQRHYRRKARTIVPLIRSGK